MPWLVIKFDTNPELLPQLENLLTNAGAQAVTFEDNADQPLFEPPKGAMPVWDNTRLSALFDAAEDLESIAKLIASVLQEKMPPYRIEAIEDKDWEREWMANFHPIQFGRRLWVCPSWRQPPNKDAVNLMLDPGLAFGTGTHPTTALCLRWLDEQDLEGKIVVDYGCGSGILAIAARLLGAQTVWAVDNDPQALIATKDNAQRNNINDGLLTLSPEDFQAQFYQQHDHGQTLKADFLVANILAAPLINLAATLEKLVKTNGKFALSGILENQAEQVKSHYSQWFEIEELAQEQDWVRINGRKN